ncbi:oligosaccharide flippase family protein [Photobacterium sanguinicancri]|uniref:oligosaccharide flippase family protein n=1 Tax=Photobacterium sanguinicancri TaxID=875932 RepID=UPI0021C2D18D|nr:oligosaccharide flippase family protein [Photobacterium sanguinicancri]
MTRAILNALLLFLSQVGGYLIPLLEIPFLTRVISPSVLGEVFFIQSWMLTLSLVVEYGFNYNATKKIAENKNCQKSILAVVSEVTSAKVVSCAVITLVLVIGITLFLPASIKLEWVVFAYLQFVGFSFSPYWYFQGKEQLKGVVSFDVTVRFLALGCLFLFVGSDVDAGYILLIQGGAGFALTVITNGMMFYKEGAPQINIVLGIKALKAGWHYFLFKSSSTVLLSMNSILVGFISSMELLAIYVGAEKIMKAILGLSNPVITAFYPYFCTVLKENKVKYLKELKYFIATLTSLGILGVVIGLFSYEWIINLFLGASYVNSKDILVVYLFLIPLRMMSQSISVGYLLPNEKVKLTSKVVLLSTLLNLTLAIVLINAFSVIGMVYTILAVECFLILAFLFLCKNETVTKL